MEGVVHPKFQLKDGILRYEGRVWVGANPSMHQKIMHSMHASAIEGHSGFQVTYSRLSKLFAWLGMKKDVRSFVSSCFVCKQAKVKNVKYPGLLQPLPVPEHAWQIVSTDFIEGLPRSSN